MLTVLGLRANPADYSWAEGTFFFFRIPSCLIAECVTIICNPCSHVLEAAKHSGDPIYLRRRSYTTRPEAQSRCHFPDVVAIRYTQQMSTIRVRVLWALDRHCARNTSLSQRDLLINVKGNI